ncbi:MAG: Gfo/Idh/MocA family protein [Chthoniobacterales bacterium]
MKKINFAVIGAHRRGKISLLSHRPEEGLQLVAACGKTIDKIASDSLDEYIKKCGPGVQLTTDYQDIVKNPDIDAVFVCSPDYLHAEHAIACLEAGKYVYLEKPLAITVEDCDLILEASEKSGGKLYVGHNMRFFPVFRKMRELIDAGRIGRVEAIWCRHFISYGGDAYYKDWHSERRFTTSLLLQKASHDIDIIHYLAGSHTNLVTAMGKLSVYNEVTDRREENENVSVLFDRSNWPPLSQKKLSPKIDVEDHSMVLMQMKNGVQASYMQCHYTPDDVRNYTVIGTEGRIENYGDHSSEEKWATVNLWNRRNGYDLLGHEVFRIPYLQGEHGGADPLIVADFIRLIRGEKTVGASPHDARMAAVVGCQAADSLRNGSIPKTV